ncbi:MAG: diadenylate cyclase CdaA [Flavobacteriales bacterium]|nr:diadenylate cyclase CdaA [Flavobacteriales bacterium]
MNTLFITVGLLDIFDILLVAVLLFQVYQLVKGTAAINIFFGILSIYILYLIVDALQMRLLSQILGQFIGVGMIALIIVFQQEIRRFLLFIGSTGLQGRFRFIRRFIPKSFQQFGKQFIDWDELENGLNELSNTKTGALIVLLKNSELKFYIRSGVQMEAKLSAPLLTNLFFKNSPLHDGAIIVKNNMIKAARCILPLTEKSDFPSHLGLRHRAAVGVTEHSDAIAIIVSEQTGQVSLAYHGNLYLNLQIPELMKMVRKFMNDPERINN